IDLNRLSPRIKSVFYELLDRVRWALHNLSGCDQPGDGFGKDLNSGHEITTTEKSQCVRPVAIRLRRHSRCWIHPRPNARHLVPHNSGRRKAQTDHLPDVVAFSWLHASTRQIRTPLEWTTRSARLHGRAQKAGPRSGVY